jgi:hypothetical protein
MLKYQIDNLEGVDESLRDLYEEINGKFVLKVEDGPKDLTEDVEKLKKALENERNSHKEDKRTLMEKLTALETAKKPVEKSPEIKSDDPNILALQHQLKQQNEKLALILDEKEKLTKENRIKTITDQLVSKATKKVVPEALDDLKLHVELGKFDITDDGKVVVKGSGETIDEWIDETVKSKPYMQRKNVSSNAAGGESTKFTKTDETRYNELMAKETISPMEQIEAAKLVQKIKNDTTS